VTLVRRAVDADMLAAHQPQQVYDGLTAVREPVDEMLLLAQCVSVAVGLLAPGVPSAHVEAAAAHRAQSVAWSSLVKAAVPSCADAAAPVATFSS